MTTPLLFRTLARLVTDIDVGVVDDWRWSGPTDELAQWCERLDAPDVARKAQQLASAAPGSGPK